MAPSINQFRLDVGESLFFQRQLEFIDSKMYDVKYQPLKGRQLVPTQADIPEWAGVYTWREFDQIGSAAFISDYADDLPAADAFKTENTKLIKPLGASYRYNVMEIKRAAAANVPLEQHRANSALRAIEQKIDSVLALGDAAYGLEGLLNLTDAQSYTPSTKSGGGLTWGTLAAPNATPDEIARDLMAMAAARHEDTRENWSRYRIVLPLTHLNLIKQLRMGDASNISVFDYVMATSDYITDIQGWYKATGAGAGATDRMMCYPADDTEVLAGIVPMEATPMPPQERNLAFVVNMLATCGGVILRYPVAVSYGDGI